MHSYIFLHAVVNGEKREKGEGEGGERLLNTMYEVSNGEDVEI